MFSQTPVNKCEKWVHFPFTVLVISQHCFNVSKTNKLKTPVRLHTAYQLYLSRYKHARGKWFVVSPLWLTWKTCLCAAWTNLIQSGLSGWAIIHHWIISYRGCCCSLYLCGVEAWLRKLIFCIVWVWFLPHGIKSKKEYLFLRAWLLRNIFYW